MVDNTPSDLDDLFGFGSTEAQPTSDPFGLTPAPAQQYGSRREARDAVERRPAERRAVERRAKLSRPSTDRRAVVRASRELEAQPASRKLRRAELALMHKNAPKPERRNPLRALATFAVVGGLFATAGLPAYAMTNTAATTALAAQNAEAANSQSIVVSADAVLTAASRDGYQATTSAELAEMSKDEIRAQNNAEYLLSGARELGDDYPWYYELSEYQGASLSPLNYYYRQCTDFVAWRLNRDAGVYRAPFKWVWSTLTPTGGNASQWEYAWEQHGWTVSTTPVVGSVAWFGWSNHVAYVKSVNADGTVTIEEYNYVPNVYGQRTIPASDVESFLYPPS